jgi:hypothetical protein
MARTYQHGSKNNNIARTSQDQNRLLTVTVTPTANGGYSLTGDGIGIGDSLESLGRGLAYGKQQAIMELGKTKQLPEERAPQPPKVKVWKTRCRSCKNAIAGDEVKYWCTWNFPAFLGCVTDN